MRRPGLEFVIVLAVVAVVMVLSNRPRTPEPQSSAPTLLKTAHRSQIPTPNPNPAFVGQEDYWNAEGLEGFEEVLALSIPQPTAERRERGRQLAEANCTTCHGPKLDGEGDRGRLADPPPRNFRETGDYKYGHRERALYRSIFYGVKGTGLAPYKEVLTSDQIWDVAFYIRSIQQPEGQPTAAP